MATLAFTPQDSNAQFFKKVGKALDKFTSSTPTNTGTNTTTSTTADGAKVVNNLTDFTVDFKGVKWYKDFCGIEFVVTNTGSTAKKVYSFERVKVFDANGTEYTGRTIVGNSMTSLGNGDFDFEPGVPVKCIFALYQLPKAGVTMSLCQIRSTMHNPQKGYEDRFIEFRNVVIPPVPVAASGPFKGEWTLKGQGAEGKLTLDFYSKSITGMDAEGNSIKCYGNIYVAYGTQIDECPIIKWKTNGNLAQIQYIGSRDGNTYQSLLTYDPSTKKMSISETKVVVEEGMGNCFVQDGLVFTQ